MCSGGLFLPASVGLFASSSCCQGLVTTMEVRGVTKLYCRDRSKAWASRAFWSSSWAEILKCVNDEAEMYRDSEQIIFRLHISCVSTDIYYWRVSSLMVISQLFMSMKLWKCLILWNTGAYVWFKYIEVIDTWSMKYLMDIHIVQFPSYCHFLIYRQYFWLCKKSSTQSIQLKSIS